MKKRLKNLSIQQRISYSFTLFFTVLVICIIFVLRGIYSSQMYEKLMQGRSYEDNLIVQQMAGLASNTGSCCNSIIVNLNNTLELKDVYKRQIIGYHGSDRFLMCAVAVGF